MRIEEYNSDQQDKIFELEGKRETTVVTKIQKTRSITPTSMRSITPLDENGSFYYKLLVDTEKVFFQNRVVNRKIVKELNLYRLPHVQGCKE